MEETCYYPRRIYPKEKSKKTAGSVGKLACMHVSMHYGICYFRFFELRDVDMQTRYTIFSFSKYNVLKLIYIVWHKIIDLN